MAGFDRQEDNAFQELDFLSISGLLLSSLESLDNVNEDEVVNAHELQAIHNKKRILEMMRDLKDFCTDFDQPYLDALQQNIAKDLQQRGDHIDDIVLDRCQRMKRKLRQIRDCFLKVADVADAVFDWLEESGSDVQNNIKKQEGVLRGIVHIADLANKSASFAILQLSCILLESFVSPWKEKVSFILSSLEEISEKQEKITKEVGIACEVLEKIVQTNEWDQSKADIFDNQVRKCVDAISKCQRDVEGVEKETNELLFKFNCVKWFERVIRMVCLIVSWVSIHEYYVNGQVNKTTFLGACFLSGVMCFGLFPSSVRKYCSEIKTLAMEHRKLETKLYDLKRSLHSAYSYRHRVERRRNNTL